MYQSDKARRQGKPTSRSKLSRQKSHQKTYTKAHAQIPQRSRGKENEAKKQSNEKMQPTWKNAMNLLLFEICLG